MIKTWANAKTAKRIKTKNEIEEREAYRKLGINLEKLLKYSDGKHYYHSLLKKIFDFATNQKEPIKYSQSIRSIKKIITRIRTLKA